MNARRRNTRTAAAVVLIFVLLATGLGWAQRAWTEPNPDAGRSERPHAPAGRP